MFPEKINFNQMDPFDFDQSENGRRNIYMKGYKEYVLSDFKDDSGIHDTISIIENYIHCSDYKNKSIEKLGLIKFHLGQLYANIGKYNDAICIFENLQNMDYDGVGKEYLAFLILFLRDSFDLCEILINELPNNGGVMNIDVMKRMMTMRKSTFLEAYSGTNRKEIKKQLICYL